MCSLTTTQAQTYPYALTSTEMPANTNYNATVGIYVVSAKAHTGPELIFRGQRVTLEPPNYPPAVTEPTVCIVIILLTNPPCPTLA